MYLSRVQAHVHRCGHRRPLLIDPLCCRSRKAGSALDVLAQWGSAVSSREMGSVLAILKYRLCLSPKEGWCSQTCFCLSVAQDLGVETLGFGSSRCYSDHLAKHWDRPTWSQGGRADLSRIVEGSRVHEISIAYFSFFQAYAMLSG